MSPTQSSTTFPVLDGLRAISILLVLACHLLPLGPKALRLNETAGAMGMSLFFALSGFLITYSLVNYPSVKDFLIRRLTRILPLAYLYTLIVFLIFTFNPTAMFFTDLFMVNYLTQYLDPGWTAHFWSLCVEIHFYLLIALVVLVSGRNGLWFVWPACLAITLLRINAGAYISNETHLRVDEILSGACAATLFHSSVKFKVFPFITLCAATLWAVSSYPLSETLQYFRPYAAAILLLGSLHYGKEHPKTLLAARPLRYIATISYALYIIHPATALGWMNEGNILIKYLVKRPISFALTFLLAHLSTFYWEQPWQNAMKRRLQRRRQIEFAKIGGATD